MLTPYSKKLLETELERWHDEYLPVRGTVLDLGAGCGETAHFYLLHGAKRVIAVESYERAYQMLCNNFNGNPRVIPIHATIDKIKCDIEGSEEDLDLEIHFDFSWQLQTEREGVTLWRLKKTGQMRGNPVL